MNADAENVAPPKTNLFKCIVPGCRSSTRTNIAKLHSFPWRDMPRAQKWIEAVGCLELLGKPPKALLRLRVCDLHFDKNLKRGKNMKLWDNTAVPTLHLATVKQSKLRKRLPKQKKNKKIKNGTPTPSASENSTSTAAGTSSGNVARGAGAGAANAAMQTPIRVPRELAKFLTLRDKLQKMNTAPKGYDRKFAVFALNLYLSCPSAYRVLRKSLRLPQPAALTRLDLGVGTRFNTDLIKCFESKMEKVDHSEKDCMLCIDEVELTKKLFYAIDKDEVVGLEEIGGVLRVVPATRALVLVVRGISGRWMQPLGYFYLAERTKIRELVAPLRKLIAQISYGVINCRVRAIVSALGPTFAELATELGVSIECPYAIDAVPRRRIWFLHDPEQLVLTLRDTLLAYDIKFHDASNAYLRASWRDVEALHQLDSARELRLLPELTRARVRPNRRESLRVQHAAAVFSRSVAAKMGTSAALDAKSVGTVRLLHLMGDLRLALAAPRGRDLPRVTAAIDAACSALSDMRVVALDGAEHDAEVFALSLQVSLAGILQLLTERASDAEDKAPLRLARCGLRPVRRFIERLEGARGRVSPRVFRREFRRWTMRHLLKPVPPARGSRVDDLGGLIWKAEDKSLLKLDGGAKRCVAVGELDHRVDLSEDASLQHVAVSLLRQCRRAHGCPAFVEWAKKTDRMCEIVYNMNAIFRKMFEKKALNVVGRLALPALDGCIEGYLPCACFPRNTFCRLFVRFRIRAALQITNSSFRGVSKPGTAMWQFRLNFP